MAQSALRGKLLIALVKNSEDIVVGCDAHCADNLKKPLDQIVGRPSSEIWPEGRNNYRRDDAQVLTSGRPLLGIHETVNFNGEEIEVITDKYKIMGNDQVLVLVFTRDQRGYDILNEFTVALVETPEDWIPNSGADEPPGEWWRNVLGFLPNPSDRHSHLIVMDEETAESLRQTTNQRFIDQNRFSKWCVVLPPGYFP